MMLAGKFALVTGASRGIGKGIALQLGKAGATVFITGRVPVNADKALIRLLKQKSLEETAEEITAIGGKGVAIYCDHSNPNEIKSLFEKILVDSDDRLDILVNNAFSAATAVTRSIGKKFYRMDPSIWDIVNNVGLRNHYVCSTYAARVMTKNGCGLIVTVSSSGGLRYLFNTPYGVGKAACDRLAADMAHELYDSNVASISLWPGPVKTELIRKTVLMEDVQGSDYERERIRASNNDPDFRQLFINGETPGFSGKCIISLFKDPNLIRKTGHILTTTQLAKDYNLYEDDGKTQPNDTLYTKYRDFVDLMNKIRSPYAIINE